MLYDRIVFQHNAFFHIIWLSFVENCPLMFKTPEECAIIAE